MRRAVHTDTKQKVWRFFRHETRRTRKLPKVLPTRSAQRPGPPTGAESAGDEWGNNCGAWPAGQWGWRRARRASGLNQGVGCRQAAGRLTRRTRRGRFPDRPSDKFRPARDHGTMAQSAPPCKGIGASMGVVGRRAESQSVAAPPRRDNARARPGGGAEDFDAPTAQPPP